MICYRDTTFCPFHETCRGASECGRALTPEVKESAAKWWGSSDAPIATFVEKPECYEQLEQSRLVVEEDNQADGFVSATISW